MKRLLLFFVFFFYTFSLLPQELDSLLKVIKNNKVDRSYAYNKAYKIVRKQNRDSAKITFLDKAYYEAIKHKNFKQEGRILTNLGLYYKFKTQMDTAKILYEKSLEAGLKANDTLGISKVYNNLATYYFELSQYKKAEEQLEKAIEYRSLLDDPRGLGISYNTLGNVYNKWGKNKKAIDNYMIALKKFEEANLMIGVSSCYNNIGTIYQSMSQGSDTILLNKALEQMDKALEINQKNILIIQMAENQNGIANIYAAKAERSKIISDTTSEASLRKKHIELKNHYFKKSLEYCKESKINHQKIGNKRGLAASYVGIGAIFINRKSKGDVEKALSNFKKALSISQEIGDNQMNAVCLTYIGKAYQDIRQNEKSLKYLTEAEILAHKLKLVPQYTAIYEPIADAYDSLKNYQMALKYYRKYHKTYEKVTQNETKKTIANLEIEHESEKKEAALQIATKEKEKEQEKSKRQQLIIYGFIGVFVIIILFSFIVLKQFKQIQRSNKTLSKQKTQIEKANDELNQQNEEIAAQKNHIEEIHKEVSDSIHYAERIQKAILPTAEGVENKLTDRFILFKPKDIVSGDFYWQKLLPKSDLYVATAADCTGHGVPGAFMSMLGVAFLNEIVSKSSVTSTGKVLDNLRQSVISSLHQTGKEGEAQDGMDIALIAYNYKTKILQFSGANNPLYIIRKKGKPSVEISEKMLEGEVYNLYEVKGDKMPIGIYKKELTNFTTNTIELLDGDSIYMFSDGYADQFGGPKGKKLKYLPLKKLLIENVEKPMSEQSDILNNYFEKWRGKLEQIDDVIVFGIKA